MLKTSPHPVTSHPKTKKQFAIQHPKELLLGIHALALSKLHYNDVIYHSLPEYLQKRVQRVQKAATSFVLGKFARPADVLSLNWAN